METNIVNETNNAQPVKKSMLKGGWGFIIFIVGMVVVMFLVSALVKWFMK